MDKNQHANILTRPIWEIYPLFQLKDLQAQNDNVTISAQCQRDINLFNIGVARQQPWALRMLDAKGKLGSGILGDNTQLVGMFEQCRRVKATNSSIIGQTWHDFDAQYCRIYWESYNEDAYVLASLGDCLPATCSEVDVSTLYTTLDGSNVAVDNVYCFQYEETFWNDPASISAFVFLLLFILLVSCTSLYDYLKTTGDPKHQEQTELKRIPSAIRPVEDTNTTAQDGNVNIALEAEPTQSNTSTVSDTLPTTLNGNVTKALATESTGNQNSTLPATPRTAVVVPMDDEKMLTLQGDVKPEVKDVSSFSNKQSEKDHLDCGGSTCCVSPWWGTYLTVSVPSREVVCTCAERDTILQHDMDHFGTHLVARHVYLGKRKREYHGECLFLLLYHPR